MIDRDGFRPNVGIILIGDNGKVFWAKRIRDDGWQFPQGGINSDETPEQAMFRELHEEVGLKPDQVSILGVTPGWLRYRLPKKLQRTHSKPLCIGQKQVWYLLRLLGDEKDVNLHTTSHPEFGRWRWVNYWYPVNHVVPFKRNVYQQALKKLEPFARAHWQEMGLKAPPRPRWSRSSHSAHPVARARRRRKLQRSKPVKPGSDTQAAQQSTQKASPKPLSKPVAPKTHSGQQEKGARSASVSADNHHRQPSLKESKA